MLKIRRTLILALCAWCAAVAAANAQPKGGVLQSGLITPGHTPIWVMNGVIGDGGPALSGKLTELGITNTGTPFCINDAPITGQYHQFCLGANALGGGLLSYQAYGGAPQLPLLCNVNGVTSSCLGSVAGLPSVASNAALQATAITAGPVVFRAGFYSATSGGGAFYSASASACSLNSGAGDNGSQVQAPGGNCWFLIPQTIYNVQVWGAKCDGSTNDSPFFAAAVASMGVLGGQVVYVPATKASCVLKQGVTLPAGVSIEGVAGYNQPTNVFDNTEAHWQTSGTWIRCDDQTNPCFTINGPGSHLKGINVWYTQPAPSTSACGASCTMTHGWTPTTYPWTIQVVPAQNGNYVENINVINGYNCIDIEGNSNQSLGINSYGFHEDHNRWGCFNVVQQMRFIDNTISIHDWRDQTWWYIGSTDLLGYMEGDATHAGHRIGMDMYYVANAQISDVEFYEDWAGIRATDATVNSGLGTVTFGAQALQVSNMSFNQTCQGIILASGTTHFNGRFANIIGAADIQTAYVAGQCSQAWPVFFNFASDNAEVAMANVDGYALQQIATIGNGAAGVLRLSGMRASYSSFVAGGNGIIIKAGAALDMPHDVNSLFPATGAGAAISGIPNWPLFPADSDLWLSGPNGTARQNLFLTNGVGRWYVKADETAESGSNTGSNFVIGRDTDAGTPITPLLPPFAINRATGIIFMAQGWTDNSAVTIATLPTCNASQTGVHRVVANGISSPTFQQVVSATGTTIQPVFCNGASWIYQ